MLKQLIKRLQIAQGDRALVLLLLFQALFTGIFAGTFELISSVMFLDSFSPDDLPRAMFMSGILGILLAVIYAYLSRHLKVRLYVLLHLIAVGVLFILMIAGFHFFSEARMHQLTFIGSGPLIIISLLSFWTTVKGVLSTGRAKELGGLIEVVLFGGMILSFLLSPLLVSPVFNMPKVLIIGVGCLLMASVAQFYTFSVRNESREAIRHRSGSAGPLGLYSRKYTALMTTYVLIGVMVAFWLHFEFLSVADSEMEGRTLIRFLGLFFGSVFFLAWSMKRFVFGWLKRISGIQLTLLLSPVLLLILTIWSTIAGGEYTFGSDSQVFPYFFILLVVSRLMSQVLKISMEDSSLSLVFQSLDPVERQNVQSGIESVMTQFGIFLAGLILFVFMEIWPLELFHVSLGIYALVVIWFFVGVALYRSYNRFLKISLQSDLLKDRVEMNLKGLVQCDLKSTAFSLELVEFNPYFFHFTTRDKLLSYLSLEQKSLRKRIWKHLLESSPGLTDLVINRLLMKEKEKEITTLIRQMGQRKLSSRPNLQQAFIREQLSKFSKLKREPENAIGEAFQSGISNQIYAALYHVAEEKDVFYLPEVISLMRDQDPGIRKVAVSTAGSLDMGGEGARLIDLLDDPDLYYFAWSALVRQGDQVLDDLDATFHKPESSLRLQKRIVSVISAIGGEKSTGILIQKMEYQHREVFYTIVRALYENKFSASKIQIAAVKNAILRLVETGTWNLAARISVRTDDPGGYLGQVLDSEIWEINDMILMLLAMIYDRRSVRKIRTALQDKHSEDRAFAIEMLELLLDPSLKTVLISYFYDVSVREKLDKLKELYPVTIFSADVLLKRILNRNGAQMGEFIRICVLDRMGNNTRFFNEQQIIAQGFHPSPRIREIASFLLRKNYPEQYHQVNERFDFPDNSFMGHEDPLRWYLDVTIRLSKWELFAGVGMNSIFRLVTRTRPFTDKQLSEGEQVLLVRSVSAEKSSLLSGGIAIIAAEHPEILEQIRYLGSIGACEAFLVDRNEFRELLFDDTSLLYLFCNFLNQTSMKSV